MCLTSDKSPFICNDSYLIYFQLLKPYSDFIRTWFLNPICIIILYCVKTKERLLHLWISCQMTIVFTSESYAYLTSKSFFIFEYHVWWRFYSSHNRMCILRPFFIPLNGPILTLNMFSFWYQLRTLFWPDFQIIFASLHYPL